jgi:hypothetical protein
MYEENDYPPFHMTTRQTTPARRTAGSPQRQQAAGPYPASLSGESRPDFQMLRRNDLRTRPSPHEFKVFQT